MKQILSAWKSLDVDLIEEFNERWKSYPDKVYQIESAVKHGFQIYIRAIDLSSHSDSDLLIEVNSRKLSPREWDFFSFDGSEANFYDEEISRGRSLKSKVLSIDEFIEKVGHLKSSCKDSSESLTGGVNGTAPSDSVNAAVEELDVALCALVSKAKSALNLTEKRALAELIETFLASHAGNKT